MAFDMNTDYSALIKKATSAAEKARLESQRNEKINYMNSEGINKGGWTPTNNYQGSSNDTFAGYGKTSGKVTTTSNKNLVDNILKQMNANSTAWHTADEPTRRKLEAQNQALVTQNGINAVRGQDGIWYYNGTNNGLYDTTYAPDRNYYPEREDMSQMINDYYAQAQRDALLKAQYATDKGVMDLEAALRGALPSYQTMRDQSSLATAKNMDNQALRSALLGDTGGLANKQYSMAQSAGDNRLLQINLEQRNLENSTEAAIAQLKAEGKFQEADIIAKNAQAKIAELMKEKDRIYQSQVDAFTFDTNQEFKEAGLTGIYKGNPTLDKQAFDNSLRQQTIDNAMDRLNRGLFTAQDAETLGIPTDQAKAFADRINMMAQLDIKQAQAHLNNIYASTNRINQDIKRTQQELDAYKINDNNDNGKKGNDEGINTPLVTPLSPEQSKAAYTSAFNELETKLNANGNYPTEQDVKPYIDRLSSMGVSITDMEDFAKGFGFEIKRDSMGNFVLTPYSGK